MNQTKKQIDRKTILKLGIILLLAIAAGAYFYYRLMPEPERANLEGIPQPTYMIYYGKLNSKLIRQAKQYDVVILHPKQGNLTRSQVREIQSAGACVLGYLSIGEDLRTAGMTPEDMLKDWRFTGDGSGPRVDGREAGDESLDHVDLLGAPSPAGSGYASYYLDDNDHDGKPDFNPSFGCAYTNIGDPAWYDALQDMMMGDSGGTPGIREILTTDYGRGLGCDGLLLDTVDTCAPNSYTDDSFPGKTRFEWTAPGVSSFLERLRTDYPDAYILQNRGLFFFHYQLPHFNYTTGQYIDFLLYESYMLDSNTASLYSEMYFQDNKNVYAPKINAEANRPDGFRVLSLGYAEGPEEYQLKETLTGNSAAGLDILLADLEQAQNEAGFSHYITDGALLLTNDFVLERTETDCLPPVWSSVHTEAWDKPPVPRVGIGQAEPVPGGMTVRWDVAVDRSGVEYTLYYQKTPFDFAADPDLENAEKMTLIPNVGDGYQYGAGPDIWPYQAVVENLDAGETYYFVIRARDLSQSGHEEKNTVVLEGVPL